MFEKVNPMHPDKIADRIAGACVDMAYAIEDDPKIAVEVLIGHGECHVIIESTVILKFEDIKHAINRISGISQYIETRVVQVPQDKHLTENQADGFRCGDNGIFKGAPITKEQKRLSELAKGIYRRFPYDGKYILNGDNLVICQSNVEYEDLSWAFPYATINPLGSWTGGLDVDTGATNRKLGSDMGDGVTGGGLHGKDLSKADVTINIYLHLLAQKLNYPVFACCAIGDDEIVITTTSGMQVERMRYSDMVKRARAYIKSAGGFEKFAEWGLV